MSPPLPKVTVPEGRPARMLAAALLGLMVSVQLAILHFGGAAASSDALANAITVDLTLGGSLVIWYFGIRRGGLPWVVLLPTFLAGLGLSRAMVGGRDPIALDLLEAGAVAAEIAILVVVVRGLRRGVHALGREAGDPLAVIREVVEGRMGGGLAARIVASEIGALWFAVASWRHPAPDYGGARRFAYGRAAAGVHAALLLVSAVELVAVHLLVSRWSGTAAWVLTGLALYGSLWILADLRAIRLRPVTLRDGTLVLRTGLRWTMELRTAWIVSASRRDWRQDFGAGDGELSLAVMGKPEVILDLDRPVKAIGPFGITRTAHRVGLTVDERDVLIAALHPEG